MSSIERTHNLLINCFIYHMTLVSIVMIVLKYHVHINNSSPNKPPVCHINVWFVFSCDCLHVQAVLVWDGGFQNLPVPFGKHAL